MRGRKSMRAVVLEGVGGPLAVRDDYPSAGTARSGGEVIEVTACGVCHSDLHVADGDYPSPLPLVLGHEVTGVHSELGPVMVYAPWGCGSCRQCLDGEEMICADATEAGLLTDGGYSERMWVKHSRYLAALDGLDPVASAPLACGGLTAYRAVGHGLARLRALGAQARALVIGAGGLGQFALSYLRLLSEAHVVAVDSAADKRTQALALGAHQALEPDDLVPAGAAGGSTSTDRPGPFDLVIDFVGADATLAAAAANVARKGVVVVVGLAYGTVAFGLRATPPESRFMSSFWGTRAQLDELLDFARREPSIIQPVTTLPLADAQTAHDRLRAGQAPGRIVLTV